MIEPLQRDEAFLADVAAHDDALWWLGQSGFLLAWRGTRVLLDPYLSDSLTRKYAGTAKPHVRMTERVVDPGRLPAVDVVTASHAHTDHLDPDTLRALPAPALVAPEAHRALAAERSGRPADAIVGVDAGHRVEVAGVAMTAVPAAHNTVERDAEGRHKHLGYVVDLGGLVVFHAGDTLPHPGLVPAVRAAAPAIDVALLPINGDDPARGVAGNLDGPEAAQLARDVRAGVAVPCHFEMFAFNTASPAAFAAACERLAVPYRVLRAGERLDLG